MQYKFFFAILFLLPVVAVSQGKRYEYTIDLTTVVNDRVRVDLIPPRTSENEITFYMPRVIPGTYAVADYGRFVTEISVTDKRGNSLPVQRKDENTWLIRDAKKISRISYWVNDTFDAPAEGAEIFWPAGTNIEAGKNFILNSGGFFGFIEGLTEIPFQINIIRGKGFYGSTGLIPIEIGKAVQKRQGENSKDNRNSVIDVFRAADYEELIDSPFMYSAPDTAIVRIGGTEVLVGSYSPNKLISAAQIAGSIRDVLEAQKEFLGGKLPVDKYAFIFYFTDQPVIEYGALEHSNSSLYYMPEATIEEMSEELRDIAAHEFFHILTPLTIHSEQIEDFDYNNPEMSQHLWLYEGVTEYFSGIVRVKYGLITIDEFLNVLVEKMHTSDQFRNDVPFTEISKYTLDKYHDQFYNVYQKGALIALCLDLKLLKHSLGKYGLQDLMLDLSGKFGKDTAFEDERLFEEIARMTSPQVLEFFNRHVRGIEVLPLQGLMSSVGIEYIEEEKSEDFSLGITSEEVGVTEIDGKPRLQVSSTVKQNAMGAALGLEEGDVLIAINGETLPELGPALGELLHKHHNALPETKTLQYKVLRKNESGEWKEVHLSADVMKIEVVSRHILEIDPNATLQQLALRDSWLKP